MAERKVVKGQPVDVPVLLAAAYAAVTHEGHDVHPHHHVSKALCPGRWFCSTCRSPQSPAGTWFTGKKCHD